MAAARHVGGCPCRRVASTCLSYTEHPEILHLPFVAAISAGPARGLAVAGRGVRGVSTAPAAAASAAASGSAGGQQGRGAGLLSPRRPPKRERSGVDFRQALPALSKRDSKPAELPTGALWFRGLASSLGRIQRACPISSVGRRALTVKKVKNSP